MANPTPRWDGVPIYGVWFRAPGDTPDPGEIQLSVSQRIQRTDGHAVYPGGATVKVRIGDADAQISAVRESVRAAWRAADAAAAGAGFDGTAWDVWWTDVVVPAAIFTAFPAADDPDIVHPTDVTTDGYRVKVMENLQSGAGREYYVQPLLSHLDQAIPGINLGLVEVPPGSPSVPAPVYSKGIAGGVASLDSTGKVPVGQIPDGIGGASTVAELTDATAVGKAVATATDQAAARAAIAAAPTTAATTASAGLVRLGTNAEAVAGTSQAVAVTPAGMAAAVAQAVSALVASAPGALDNFYELAAALGNDPAFATTVLGQLATQSAAIANKANAATSPPWARALTSTTIQSRASVVQAGYTGPVVFNIAPFPAWAGTITDQQHGDIRVRRA